MIFGYQVLQPGGITDGVISGETGHSKNTIKKILRGEYIGYKPRVEQPYPILGPYLKIIDEWLESDK